MSSSSCTLRSAHCAALIALAAVAGIVRVETAQQRSSEGCSRSTSSFEQRVGHSSSVWAHFTVATSSPWLRQLATVAAWLLQSERPTSPAMATVAVAPATPAAPLPSPTSLERETSYAFDSAPTPALCTVAHLIPFPAGPPADATPSPLAAGTIVPGDSTAFGMPVQSVSRVAPFDEVSSLTRLARMFDPRAVSAGSSQQEPRVSSAASRRLSGRFTGFVRPMSPRSQFARLHPVLFAA